jgi:hypothetical protein
MTLIRFDDDLNKGLCMAKEGNVQVYWRNRGIGSHSIKIVTPTYRNVRIETRDVPAIVSVLKYLCEEEWK